MSTAEHEARVHAIAAEVRDRIGRGEPVHIDKGGVHHVVPLPGDRRFRSRAIDVSMLRRVLQIDREARLCVAEPGITFAELVDATLPFGLVPAVVPELEGITIGGAVAGCAVESTSYRVGGFFDTCHELELVSGAGEVLTVSREVEPLLFEMVHGSYGTLAILTRLTFDLVPAEPYVELSYERHSDPERFFTALKAHCDAAEFEFIDGIVHGPSELVLCLGRYVASAPYTSDYRGVEIFYKSTRTRTVDYLRTRDYFFRYDTECHWLTRTVPGLENRLVRRLVGKYVLGSTNLIRWSNRLAPVLGAIKRRPDVVVDLFIPYRRIRDFWGWYVQKPRFFPLWVIPYRVPKFYPWLSPAMVDKIGDNLLIDCAIYGMPNGEPDRDWSQVFEEQTYAHDGVKTLISRNHYSRERFFAIYNEDNYEKAKQRLDPHGVFPRMYEKLHRV
ncbi:MAG TPA: FAD-binding oxidoreductase [Nannocystis sp.]